MNTAKDLVTALDAFWTANGVRLSHAQQLQISDAHERIADLAAAERALHAAIATQRRAFDALRRRIESSAEFSANV